MAFARCDGINVIKFQQLGILDNAHYPAAVNVFSKKEKFTCYFLVNCLETGTKIRTSFSTSQTELAKVDLCPPTHLVWGQNVENFILVRQLLVECKTTIGDVSFCTNISTYSKEITAKMKTLSRHRWRMG